MIFDGALNAVNVITLSEIDNKAHRLKGVLKQKEDSYVFKEMVKN